MTVTCRLCRKEFEAINWFHLRTHGITFDEYREQFPDEEVASEEYKERRRQAVLGPKNPMFRIGEDHHNFGKTTPEETIQKMSEANLGQKPWNRGIPRSEETKQKQSETMKEGYRTGRIKLSPLAGRGNGGFFEDLGHYLRSMWEANLARVLKSKGIDYQYEPQRFHYITYSEVSYRPDFYLPALDLWIEVKGYMDEEDRLQINVFEENHNLQVIDEDRYHELEKLFANKIENWDLRPQEHQKQVDLEGAVLI